MKSAWTRIALGLWISLCAHAAAAADKIHTFEPDSYRHIVAQHQGQAFVIVVWSLDCDYCVPSFKTLADTQRRHKLPVVAITTDPADEPTVMASVRKKIAGTGLVAETWAFGSEPVEQLRYAIDPKWRGEMPRSYWYDGKGKVTAYSGVINPDVITRHIAGLQQR